MEINYIAVFWAYWLNFPLWLQAFIFVISIYFLFRLSLLISWRNEE